MSKLIKSIHKLVENEGHVKLTRLIKFGHLSINITDLFIKNKEVNMNYIINGNVKTAVLSDVNDELIEVISKEITLNQYL